MPRTHPARRGLAFALRRNFPALSRRCWLRMMFGLVFVAVVRNIMISRILNGSIIPHDDDAFPTSSTPTISQGNNSMDAFAPMHRIHSEERVPFLPIYYLNMDQSTDRRRLMKKMMKELHLPNQSIVRVPSHNVSKIKSMLRLGLFRLENNVTFESPGGDPVWFKRSHQRYDFKEGACLITHLDAIRRAFQAGHEYVLILEDDARLSPKFVRYWRKYAELAPDDWNLLQWANDFNIVFEQGKRLTNDPWTSWTPEHWSARANMYNRRGMEQILQRTHTLNEQGQDVWTLRGEPTLLADELLYYYAGAVYTSTKPWIGRFEVETTVQIPEENPHISNHHIPSTIPRLEVWQRPESILILSQYHLQSAAEAEEELNWLRVDASAICAMHANCKWHVHTVLMDPDLLGNEVYQKTKNSLPPYVDLHEDLNDGLRSMFAFVLQFEKEMNKYDLLLLKSYDHRAAGFPWDTFVNRKGKSVIASPLHEVPEEGMQKAAGKVRRFPYRLHDCQEWQRAWHTKWSADIFESIDQIRTPYLEPYFILMDAAFGHWFFPKVLLPSFLQKFPEWNPDLLWCSAAETWNRERPSCYLLPLIAKVEASKVLDADPNPNRYLKEKALAESWVLFRDQNEKFVQWTKKAQLWKETIWWQDLKMIEDRCIEKPFLVDPSRFTLQECIDNVTSMISMRDSDSTSMLHPS